eukprot:3266753-Pyramimonas_sp.AAC.1
MTALVGPRASSSSQRRQAVGPRILQSCPLLDQLWEGTRPCFDEIVPAEAKWDATFTWASSESAGRAPPSPLLARDGGYGGPEGLER